MITYIIPVIIGWISGALVNYLADVLPLRRRFTQPFCIQCDTTQSWKNYFLWPRRCPVCNHPRGIRVWIVEGFYVIAGVLIALYPPAHLGYLLGMVVFFYFGVVVLIDLEYRLIMHPVSIAGVGIGMVVGVIRMGWVDALIGGAVGFGSMWLLYMLGILLIKLVDRLRGRPVNDVALGFGDVNLSGVLGLMLGWPQIIIGLVISVLIGGLVSFVYLIIKLATHKYEAFMALPYGPFLVLGAALIIYFRDALLAIFGN